jgi:hypothetical protein
MEREEVANIADTWSKYRALKNVGALHDLRGLFIELFLSMH